MHIWPHAKPRDTSWTCTAQNPSRKIQPGASLPAKLSGVAGAPYVYLLNDAVRASALTTGPYDFQVFQTIPVGSVAAGQMAAFNWDTPHATHIPSGTLEDFTLTLVDRFGNRISGAPFAGKLVVRYKKF